MNFLAHIFLSGTDRQIQIGNFIGDAVKGNSYNDYLPSIRKGILLHRAIDHFTDHHPVVREMLKDMRPAFGRYSGIVLDMYFDYFLASRFSEFSKSRLRLFTVRFYLGLIWYGQHLPESIKGFMWHLIFSDRLNKYANKEGIRRSLEIMVKYKRIAISADLAISYLTENEDKLFLFFLSFFNEVRDFADDYLNSNR